MAAEPPGGRRFRFGPFELDEASGDLRDGARVVRLQGKPLAALVVLLEHPRQVVTREMLRVRLWPDGEHVDAEQGIANALLKVREAIADPARAPRWIETLPRRGYRWIGEVARLDTGQAPSRQGPVARRVVSTAAVVSIALLVVAAGRWLDQAPSRVPADPVAREQYARARHLAALKTPEALEASVEAFRAALSREADFAPAWSGLAASYHFLGAVSVLSWGEARRRTREAADRALAIDAGLAEAHAVIGESLFRFGAGADDPSRYFTRALALDPDAPDAHQWYGNYLAVNGRMDDAVGHLQRARALDPLSAHIAIDLAALFYEAGQRSEAAALLDRTLLLHPHHPKAHHLAGRISLVEGRGEDAVSRFERARQLSPDTPKLLEFLALAYAETGRVADAMGVVEDLRLMATRVPLPPGLLARVEARVSSR